MSKRITVVAVAFVLAVAFSALPAQAGVGGCRYLASCTGTWEVAPATPAALAVKEEPVKASIVSSLGWILPGDVVVMIKGAVKAYGQGDDSQTEGVGGCLFGCGGGWL